MTTPTGLRGLAAVLIIHRDYAYATREEFNDVLESYGLPLVPVPPIEPEINFYEGLSELFES